jgi:hypothetical protein
MTPSSVRGESALLLGVKPYEPESGAHELGPGSLGALGLLEAGLSDSSFHDGGTVEGGAGDEGDAASFLRQSI